ncbi:MAG: hypothetical protein WCS49_03560, partial [Bacilli bacterium]
NSSLHLKWCNENKIHYLGIIYNKTIPKKIIKASKAFSFPCIGLLQNQFLAVKGKKKDGHKYHLFIFLS